MNNPLADLLPPKIRQSLYGLLVLAATFYSIYEASNGDWAVFTGSALAALTALLAVANTNSGELPPDEYEGGYHRAVREELPDAGEVSLVALAAYAVVLVLFLGLISLLGWI